MKLNQTNASICQIVNPGLSWLFLALTAAFAIWWLADGMWWADDGYYRLVCQPNDGAWYCEYEGAITNASQAWESVCNQHGADTSRLPNYLQTFSNLLPLRAVQVFHGLQYTLMVLLIAWGVKGRRSLSEPLLIATAMMTSWLMLPLYDDITSSAVAFNYLTPTLFGLPLVYLVLNPAGGWRRWLPWVLAAICGTMHEALAFPLACGIIAMGVLEKPHRWWRIGIGCVLGLVAAGFILNAGIAERQAEDTQKLDRMYFIILVLSDSWGLYAACVGLLSVWVMRGWREAVAFGRRNIIYIVSILAGMAIGVITSHRGRALWWVDVFGIILMLKGLWVYVGWFGRSHRIVAVIVAALTLTSMGGAAHVQQRLADDARAAVESVRGSGEMIAFVDYKDAFEAPWWTFSRANGLTDIGLNWYIQYFPEIDGVEGTLLVMLPAEFAGKDPDSWPKTPGGTILSGRYPYYATRHRVPDFERLRLQIHGYKVAPNPVYWLLNELRGAGASDTTDETIAIREWPTIYQGDTLWCYHMGDMRNLNRQRRVIGVTYIDD